MESITRVPSEMVKMIPLFDGDCRQLPLFIKKCEYILHNFQGGDFQNEYLFHVVTSRLAGEAANIVGERDQINTWTELKQLLRQQFGDPRTEECLVLELESAKINKNESYLEFCHRIQHLRSILFAKLDETIMDKTMRLAKQHIYTNTSLNVFLYNLPPYLVRLVRLRNICTLEEALQTVLEEQNFQNVYTQKNGTHRYNNNQQNQVVPRENRPQYNLNHRERHNVHANDRLFNAQNRQNRPPPRQNFDSYGNRYLSQNHFRSQDRFQNPSQQMLTPPSQHLQNNGNQNQRNMQNVASGSNTDVTMRTMSSRRVNYTNNNDHDELEPNHEIQPIENFHIEASQITKK